MRLTTGTVGLVLFLLSIFYYSDLFCQSYRNSTKSIVARFHVEIPEPKTPSYFEEQSFPIRLKRFFAAPPLASDTTKKKDRDGDGIVDSLDKCPDEKGVIQYDGCPVPDSDNDGIPDDIDKCPTVAGASQYNGCPPPDTDGDKINDAEDKCPGIAGVARYGGCPVGDRDKDGVNDDDDKCIAVPGTVSNAGCPENEKANPGIITGKNKKSK
jgi:hypothetical protein